MNQRVSANTLSRFASERGPKIGTCALSEHETTRRVDLSESESISRLEADERALLSALAEFDHEARRVRDRLERQGGRAFALETRLSQLEENTATTKRELEIVRTKLESLRSRNK